MWAGLDSVHWELIGWLWLAIGGSHVSDGLSLQEGGEDIYIKDYEGKSKMYVKKTVMDKSFIISTAM